MNGDVCLSGRDIERYLGEEESRVHALRGVSLDVEFGSTHAWSARRDFSVTTHRDGVNTNHPLQMHKKLSM